MKERETEIILCTRFITKGLSGVTPLWQGLSKQSKGNNLDTRTQKQSMEKGEVETKLVWFTALPG